MLELRFFNDHPPESTEVAGEVFDFDSGTIRTEPGGNIVATHVTDHWLVEGTLFLKMECRDAVECLFADGGASRQRRGPFDRLTLIDGVLKGDEHPLAMLKESRGWTSLVGDETWDGFSVSPVPAS
jgi:hypothetical protein